MSNSTSLYVLIKARWWKLHGKFYILNSKQYFLGVPRLQNSLLDLVRDGHGGLKNLKAAYRRRKETKLHHPRFEREKSLSYWKLRKIFQAVQRCPKHGSILDRHFH